MSVLVTGGTGFVGTHLLRKLAEGGHSPIAYDAAPDYNAVGPLGSQGQVRIVKGNTLNLEELVHILKEQRVNRIVHTASLLAQECEKKPMAALRTNLEGTVNVLEAARLAGVERVVFISSIAVYGFNKYVPVDEEHPKDPVTIYGVTKLACEGYGINYSITYGIDFIALRFVAVYGPGIKRGAFSMFSDIAHGKPVTIPEGDQKCEWLHVKDAANAVSLALSEKKLKHRIFNIGSGEFASYRDIANIVKNVAPQAAIEIGEGIGDWSKRVYPLSGLVSLKRAQDELGYIPKQELRGGIEDLIRSSRS